ncbi:MAG: hypothetical protein K2J93_01595, partial [Anaeroplasmataceae bacterium]|nr:hypothetical protein [Anaeroplasmataceae bacterium]
VLEKMERKYNTDFFLKKVEKIRSVRPDISITTDVIVGFPYETEEEFKSSIEFIKKVNFSKLHVFPYSMRKGTKACSFPQIQDAIKKERTSKLIALSKILELDYAQRFLGRTMEVLIEQIVNKDYMVGHSSNYLQVHLPVNENLIKKNVLVKIEKIVEDKIFGTIIEE